ncbi:hypothetical protein [Sinimarinibacterium sp. NLF-5-8]|uniref:hypothetical protein n=1 Tax=Sinimarinibacterium sp. NLF-5-8 TaxID=2698684 RepID=UPI00137C1921|nr:hypothetical protein [Sinimarinibacterium sp. NLF-5-8]QHS11253.1 hypothetical protein GT972_14590 [Sinimarinibacterium sp. NLF-5-8]
MAALHACLRTALLGTGLLLGSFAAQAASGDEVMLGLRWGMSPLQAGIDGAQLVKEAEVFNLQAFHANTVAVPLQGFSTYQLVFARDSLVKIVASGDAIEHDPSGVKGQQRFDALSQWLHEAFGEPYYAARQIGGADGRVVHPSFYQCLQSTECGRWFVNFRTADRSVTLELQGDGLDSGFVRIIVEAQPQWPEALAEYRGHQLESAEKAMPDHPDQP